MSKAAGGVRESLKEKVFGWRPHPRILVIDPEDEFGRSPREKWMTVETSGPDEVDQAEWDVVVSAGGISRAIAPHLYCVSIGGYQHGPADMPGVSTSDSIEILLPVDVPSREFVIPDDIPRHVAVLVERDLIPLVSARDTNREVVTGFPDGSTERELLKYVQGYPLLRTASGIPLALRFTRRGGLADCWVLPEGADPVRWTEAAMVEWRTIDTVRFPPPDADWHEGSDWRTAAELAAAEGMSNEEQAIELERRAAEERLAAARARLAEATQAAEENERLLLTSQGETLVRAVKRCLEEFGFDVRDMDAEVWRDGDKREDLRVRSDEDETWEAITEVRGYKGGAKVLDLARLQRFAQRYQTDEGREPSACWYVVNGMFEDPPQSRHEPLRENPDELAFFAQEYNGLVIDTRELYRMARDVQAGTATTDEARKALLTARGHFEWRRKE